MTTKIPDDYYTSLHSRPHPAVLLTVEKSLTREEGMAVSKTIREYLEAAPDTDDMQPLWTRFVDIDATDVHFLQGFFSPADKGFLGELVLAIDEVRKFSMVSSFDFKARQYPKKSTRKATPVSAPIGNLEGLRRGLPDPNRLPIGLRFFACEEAMAEACKLGKIFGRWPFFNFDKGDLRAYSEKLVSEFPERYPYLAEADKAIGGKLTEVIAELGKHPHPPAYELRRFWKCVENGDVMAWTELGNYLLREIAKGAGNPFQHYEEDVWASPGMRAGSGDRASVTKYGSFLKTRHKPALTSGSTRGMVADD